MRATSFTKRSVRSYCLVEISPIGNSRQNTYLDSTVLRSSSFVHIKDFSEQCFEAQRVTSPKLFDVANPLATD